MCTRLFPKKSRVFQEALVGRFFLELVHALMCARDCSFIVKVGKSSLKPTWPAVDRGLCVCSKWENPTKLDQKSALKWGYADCISVQKNPVLKASCGVSVAKVEVIAASPRGSRGFDHVALVAAVPRVGERAVVILGRCWQVGYSSPPKGEAVGCGAVDSRGVMCRRSRRRVSAA